MTAAASASGMTPRVSEGQRGFSPERGEWPAINCCEKLGGEERRDVTC